MTVGQNTVDIDFRLIVDRTEIKQNVLSVPFLRDRDRTLIPEMVDKVRISYAGQFTFRTEGNSNLLVKAVRFIELTFHPRTAEIKRAGPLPIQVDPTRPLELRTGIFWTRHGPDSGHAQKKR